MNKVEVSEIFYSLEGESEEAGLPTVYIRFARCNKKCPLWNNTQDNIGANGYANLDFNPKDIKSLSEVPTIHSGCDSQYAVNPEFAHIWHKYDSTELLTAVRDLLPGKSWTHPVTGLPVILSLTGGEPTLKLKWIVEEMLTDPLMEGCKHILFETNTSVPLRQRDVDGLFWWANREGAKITWTNSPKLTNSGEPWKRSIMPQIAMMQRSPANYEWYKQWGRQVFKFVVNDQNDIDEVQKAMNEYYAAGVPRNVPVVLMPEACTTEQQQVNARWIADFCMQQGYRFSIRLQNVLWGNAIGT